MPLQAHYDAQDQIPESLREHYQQQKDGKFALAIEGAEDVTGLRRNRDDLLEQVAKAKAERLKWEGIDPEKAKQALAAQQKLEEEKARAEGNFEALRAAQEKAYAEKEIEWGKKISVYQNALEDALVTSELQNAIIALDGIPKALTPHLRSQIRVLEEDGAFVARVVDPKGTTRYEGTSGSPMSIRALVEAAKKDPDLAFAWKGTGASGGGASSGGRASTTQQSAVSGGNDAFLANLDGIATRKVQYTGT